MSAKPETVDDIISRISATAQAKTMQAFSWAQAPEVSRQTFDRGPWQQRGTYPGAQQPKSKSPQFNLTWIDDIALDTNPAWTIEGLMPAGPSLGYIIGPPKSLKSWGLMDAFVHIAIGKQYCGRDVMQGAVVYVTSEGITEHDDRLIAMRRHHGIEGKKIPFGLISVMPNLGNGSGDAEILKAEIARALEGLGVPLRAIAIDTMRRAIPGKSENEQKDVSVFVANCDMLSTSFGCFVGAVHHSPRSDDSRGSGSNAQDGAADCVWGVARNDVGDTPRATIKIARMKDGEEGDEWSFELRQVDIGTDRDGKTLTSCYVEIVAEPGQDSGAPSKRNLPPLARKFYDALVNVCIGNEANKMFGHPAASIDLWRNECVRMGLIESADAKSKAARSLFNKYKLALITADWIACNDTMAWVLP